MTTIFYPRLSWISFLLNNFLCVHLHIFYERKFTSRIRKCKLLLSPWSCIYHTQRATCVTPILRHEIIQVVVKQTSETSLRRRRTGVCPDDSGTTWHANIPEDESVGIRATSRLNRTQRDSFFNGRYFNIKIQYISRSICTI